MTVVLGFANHTATSKRYLHKKAGELSPFEMQSEDHFKTIESYSALLEQVRQEQTTK